MADGPSTNPEDFIPWFPDFSNPFTEPRNHDLISTTDTAAFTFDLSESDAQFDNDPEALSQWCHFPCDQMDFSSQVTTKHRTGHLQILDQSPRDKNVSGRHIRQHEPRMILPDFGAGSAESISSNQHASLVDEPWTGCSHVLDEARTQYPARTASLPEDSVSDSSRTPPSIESKTLKQQNSEQAVMLKKRQMGIEYGEPYPPSLVCNKRQKTAAYDYLEKDQVGTVEASFIESWLSKFPDVYPGPEQFVLLAGLTQLRTETVQSWFSKRLRNGPQSAAVVNQPMKPSTATEAPSPVSSQMSLIQQPFNQPLQRLPDLTLDKVKLEASTWVREHKAKKCRERGNPENFVRDPEKPYCCTLGCGIKFKDKDDWRKHEERNYPQRGWICDVGSIVHNDDRTLCAFCGMLNPKREHDHGKALCSEKKVEARGRLHFRKQHFYQHLIRVHPGIPCDEYLENNHFTVKSKFPRRCGFCRYLSKHWRDRIEHIGGHFIAGKDMSQWDFGVENDEVDQAKSADDENPDNDGALGRKRYKPPADESNTSDDDSNDSPHNSASKQRRRNTQHTNKRRTCSPTQSRDVNSAKECGRTTHVHQEGHSVPLNDSFLGLFFSNLGSENISYEPSSTTTTMLYSAANKKLTRPFATKAILKRIRIPFSDKCRKFNVMIEDKAIERLRHHRMSHCLNTCEDSTYLHHRTNLSTQNDLAGLIQSYAGTLIPSVEAIARWCKLLTSGNVNTDNQTITSVIRYAPEISENLSIRWSADISSLASLLLGMWRLLVDDDKATFKSLLTGLFSSSALCHENFAQFQEWITLPRKNDHVMNTRVARKALYYFDTMCTVHQKDTTIAFDFSSYLNSGIHLQPIEKPLLPVFENQQNASPISIDTTSEVPMALCVQLASVEQDASEAPRNHAPISQDDLSMPIVKSITRVAGDAGTASARTAVVDKIFSEEIPDSSLSSRSNDLSSLFVAKACAPSTGAQSASFDSGIGSSLDLSWSMPRNSYLETNFDYNNSSNTKSSYPAGIVNYNLRCEPLATLPSTEAWLESTAPWDVVSATPIATLDTTSPTFSNVEGSDLSSTLGIQEPWSSIAEDIGPITPPFLNLNSTLDAMEYSNTSVSSNSYKSCTYNTLNKMKGGRRKPLSLEARMKAALIRRKGACLRCSILHMSCDMDNTCSRCARSAQSFKGMLCIRARLTDYINFFLPDTIISRYSDTAIQVAIRRQIGCFTNNRIEVLMCTRSTYPPIPITVYEFIPLRHQSLQPRHASLVELDDIPMQNTYLDAPPLALLHYDPAEIKDKLSRHVKAIIELPLDIGETISGETWIVSYKTFEAAKKYHHARNIREKDQILELAFKLHTMHYIMNRPIIIEPSSAAQAFTKLQGSHVLPYNEKFLSANIINLQLKHEMIVLQHEMTRQFLGGVENALIRSKHSTWSTAFCLMIVMCSYIEAIEIAVDTTIVVKMQEAKMTTADISHAKYFQELEQVVFPHLEALFISTHKSFRIPGKGGFDPIRDDLELNEEKDITLPAVELIQDIRRIIKEHEDDIKDRAKDLEFETEPAKLLEDHWRPRERSSGRLVSKLLRTFC